MEEDEESMADLVSSMVKSVVEDDLAFLLYYLSSLLSEDGHVDAVDTTTGLNALQTALATRGRPRVRSLVVQILLLCGARLDLAAALERAQQAGNEEVIQMLQRWDSGGRAEAMLAAELLQLTPHDAEVRIFQEKLGIEEQVAHPTPESSAPPAPSDPVVTAVNSRENTSTFIVKSERDAASAQNLNGRPLNAASNAPGEPRSPIASTSKLSSRSTSPFVPHKLSISNLDPSTSEMELVDILGRVGGRLENMRILSTNSSTKTAYLDVGSHAARERIRDNWDGTHVNGRALPFTLSRTSGSAKGGTL